MTKLFKPPLIFWLIIAVVLVCAIVRLSPNSLLPFPYYKTTSASSDTKLFSFQNGINFRIPENYIDIPGRFGSENKVKDLLLVAYTSDFSQAITDTSSKLETPATTDIITLLLRSPERTPWNLISVAKAFEMQQRSYSVRDDGERYKLEARQQIPPSTGQWSSKKLYRDTWEKEPTVVIICDDKIMSKLPRCQHFYLYSDLLVQLNYSETSLKDWMKIQNVTKNILTKWIAK